MFRDCTLPLERLLDFHEGRLDTSAAAEVERHIAAGCPVCAERQAFLPRLSDALAPPPTPSLASRRYVQSLARLLRPEPRETLLQKVARLVTVGGGLAPVGARGTAAGAQRVFETEEHLVTLWDEAEDADRHYLIGQIYARGGGALVPCAVHLLLPDNTERDATCEGTEFHLGGIAAGVYLVRCTLDTQEVLIPGVTVGQP